MATAAALGVRQPRDKKFEKIVLEELPPDFLQDVLDPKASWTDDVLADEEEIITKHMCAGAMFTGRAAVRGMRARAVLCVDDDKDACAIAEANKTDGDGLVVLNEKIKDEAHATRLLAEEYGGPADAILADVTGSFDRAASADPPCCGTSSAYCASCACCLNDYACCR